MILKEFLYNKDLLHYKFEETNSWISMKLETWKLINEILYETNLKKY